MSHPFYVGERDQQVFYALLQNITGVFLFHKMHCENQVLIKLLIHHYFVNFFGLFDNHYKSFPLLHTVYLVRYSHSFFFSFFSSSLKYFHVPNKLLNLLHLLLHLLILLHLRSFLCWRMLPLDGARTCVIAGTHTHKQKPTYLHTLLHFLSWQVHTTREEWKQLCQVHMSFHHHT